MPFDTLRFAMRIPEKSNLLQDLRNYLIFLKDYGYSDIPLESSTILGSKLGKTNLSRPSPEMVRQPTVETPNTKGSLLYIYATYLPP